MTRRNDDSANEGLFHDNATSDAPLWPSFLSQTSLSEMRQALLHMETGSTTTADSLPNAIQSGAGRSEPYQLAMQVPRPTDRITASPLLPRSTYLEIMQPAPPAPGADTPLPVPPPIEAVPPPVNDPARPGSLIDRYSGNQTTLNWQSNGMSGEGSRLEIRSMADSRGVWQRGSNSDRVLNDVWTNPQGATWIGTVEMRQGLLVETHRGDNGAVLDTRTYNPAEGLVTTQWQDQHFGTVVREDRSDPPNANRHIIRFSGATVQVNNATGEATWIDDQTQQRWQGRVQIQADGSPYFIQTPAAPVVLQRPAGSLPSSTPSPSLPSEVAPYQLFRSPCPNGQCPNIRR